MSSDYVLGVDIGGTKIALGLVDRQGRVVAAERMDTQAAGGANETVGRMIELCRRLIARPTEAKGNVGAVGIAFAGPMDPREGRIKNPPNLPDWHGLPLVSIVRDALGLPTYIENDANAAALGEARFGAGVGVDNMVYMTVSTGIGGGAVLDGRLYRGETASACELGHIKIAYQGRECGCGAKGCLEAYSSGTALAKRAREAVASGEASMMPGLAGGAEQITARTVVEAMDQGDALARRLWDEAMGYLGAGVGSVVNTFNPRLVVLGGGLTNAGERLFAPVREGMKKAAMGPLAEVVEIVPSKLGDQVGVVGAAAVAWEQVGA